MDDTVKSMTSNRRARKRGSAMAELGPALFILLIVIFFPLLNLAMFGLTYFCCGTLTDLQADKAKVLPRSIAMSDLGPVKNTVPDAWQKTGLGAFAKLSAPLETAISYPVLANGMHVRVSTRFTASPFMPIPFIPGVPALSAPVTFTFTSQRILEDPSDFGR
jgi:hypothetical protein